MTGTQPNNAIILSEENGIFFWRKKLISIPGRFPRARPYTNVSGVGAPAITRRKNKCSCGYSSQNKLLFPQEALLVAKGVSRQLHSPSIPINFKYPFLNKCLFLIQWNFYFCPSPFLNVH